MVWYFDPCLRVRLWNLSDPSSRELSCSGDPYKNRCMVSGAIGPSCGGSRSVLERALHTRSEQSSALAPGCNSMCVKLKLERPDRGSWRSRIERASVMVPAQDAARAAEGDTVEAAAPPCWGTEVAVLDCSWCTEVGCERVPTLCESNHTESRSRSTRTPKT